MKKRLSILVLFLGIYSFYAQENVTPAYVGHNFSLEGALAALKDASTIEEFENLINFFTSNLVLAGNVPRYRLLISDNAHAFIFGKHQGADSIINCLQ